MADLSDGIVFGPIPCSCRTSLSVYLETLFTDVIFALSKALSAGAAMPFGKSPLFLSL